MGLRWEHELSGGADRQSACSASDGGHGRRLSVAREQAGGRDGREPGPAVHRIAVQHRHRLFRDGLTHMLSEEDGLEVVTAAVTDKELLEACHWSCPDGVLLEADAAQWDPLRLVRSLVRLSPRPIVIGLTAVPGSRDEVRRALSGGMTAVVSRDAGCAGIVEALRSPSPRREPSRLAAMGSPARSGLPAPVALTGREVEILGLIGAGLTSQGTATRLSISHKTVENHKQRIFAKLGVQNQAHAVSVALRAGLLRPDRVNELAGRRMAT